MQIEFNGKSNYLFPGSFNPLHQGHLNIGQYVSEKYNTLVDFEISTTNFEKPPLTEVDVANRIQIFKNNQQPWFGNLWITDAPLFVYKAKLFPDVTFIVGYDTLKRICYAKDLERVKWLVFPRHKADGQICEQSDFSDIDDVIMKNAVIAWDFVPLNISSTKIRNEQKRL